MPVLDQFRLDGNVALITGAGGGLGGAIAEAMVEAGAAAICADVNLPAAQDRVAQLQQLGPSVRAVAYAVDVRVEEAVRAMMDWAACSISSSPMLALAAAAA